MSTPLARLAPKTLVPTGEGFGGHLRLEQCDVAYALAGLPSGQSALLRAMYAGDNGQANMRDLYEWANQEAIRLSAINRWAHPYGAEFMRDLSKRVVDELVYPAMMTKCPKCKGSKSVQPNQHNPAGNCDACGSTGELFPTDAQMAEMMGVPERFWRETGMGWFVRIYGAILESHAFSIRHVRARLREDDEH